MLLLLLLLVLRVALPWFMLRFHPRPVVGIKQLSVSEQLKTQMAALHLPLAATAPRCTHGLKRGGCYAAGQ